MEKGKKGNIYYLKKLKEAWSKLWYFFWEEDNLLSWALNIIVAFILIKWVIYPGLGLMLNTNFPVVAVVSESMEHNGMGFNQWWAENHEFYESNNIAMKDFESFPIKNGFNKGDIMILYGVDEVNIGDVVVFWGGKKEPIIHRVVKRWTAADGNWYFQTKGDNNKISLQVYTNILGMQVPKGTEGAIKVIDETEIAKEDIVGKAILRVPYLGYIKIWFISLLQFLHIVN
jgi:signal peptidase I